MSSSDPTTVEERLRSSIVMCDTLKRCALFADEASDIVIPAFTPDEVRRLIPPALTVIEAFIAAARAALPASSLAIVAPLVGRDR